ncbi:MAG: protein translocase subunit SecF, partial [Planctomycetota bacterium]
NVEKAEAKKPAGPEPAARTRNDLPEDSLFALVGSASLLLAQVHSSDEEPTAGHEVENGTSSDASAQEAPDEAMEDGADRPPEEPADEAAVKSAADPFAGGTQARLTFTREVGYETVREIFVKEFGSEDQLPALELIPLMESANPGDPPRPDADFAVGDSTPYKMWRFKIKLPPGEAKKRMESIEATVADTPFFPSSNTIGGKVAGTTRMQAIYALAASLLFIVAYIWIRFQRVVFGLAAVVALVHDVLVTLGAIALSAFLAPYLGILLIDQFKIGLPVLAAFLTIIGYSLNDTIVVFDRIREVRGKAPRLTQEMVNSSINQTLARTLLTSLTTLLVVLILYMFGGQNIHTFAFALVVGVAVGTYSSVFVASPALLWMTQASKAKRIA